MNGKRILVAGIGNIFLGDDAFGVEVVRRLARRPQPAGVKVVDIGIRGIDLVFALLDGYDLVILVDTASHGQRPGTLYLIEPSVGGASTERPAMPMFDLHDLDPAKVLRTAQAMGGQVDRVVLVACEPEATGDEAQGLGGLSPSVAAAVDPAIEMIESLIAEPQIGQPATASRTAEEHAATAAMQS